MDTQNAASSPNQLLRIQAISGLAFSVFLAMHLVNTAAAALGRDAYDGTQAVLRGAYQVPVIEIVLVAIPLLVHIGAAILSVVRRGRRGPKLSLRSWTGIHRVSGYFLLAVMVGHVTATRGLALLFDAAPGFDGIAFSLVWRPAFFVPYYLGLATAGALHGTLGVGIALRVLAPKFGWPKAPVFRAIAVAGAIVLLPGVATFAGVFGPMAERARASAYARTVLALVEDPALLWRGLLAKRD